MSLGYGFLWNNLGIGEVLFVKNMIWWKMVFINYIDYVVIVGDILKEIFWNYSDLIGKVFKMFENLLGLW